MRDRLPAPSDFFWSMVIMYYFFALFKKIYIKNKIKWFQVVQITREGDRGSKTLPG